MSSPRKGMNMKISKSSVQHGLERKNTGALQSLWIEVPGWCNLACSYCYASGGKPERVNDLMAVEDYERILDEAAAMGADSIGVPGAGEPLIKKNLELTLRILRGCRDRGMFVTLFTTGEFMDEPLAKELLNLPVELMIKCNSLDPKVQDKFVSNPALGKRGRRRGYGAKRNRALELLMSLGFNHPTKWLEKYGRPSRLAIVTSIMSSSGSGPSNYEEMAALLRFAREHNFVFDVDSVLKRGRGATCNLCEEDTRLKAKLLELQAIDREEFGKDWPLSQSYIGTVCDRYMHHLYIDQYGDIRPCIGAMDVNLGNIRRGTSLEEAWGSQEMSIVRRRQYRGKCAECLNFREVDPKTGKFFCNSCLGRRTVNLTNESLRTNGFVETTGCWNHRPCRQEV